MTNLTIRDTFDLPAEIPQCIVKIIDFDDDQTMQENIRDYVITDTVAAEMERLVDRIVASCVRHEAGQGHYLHGSFGSGKSHFMAILGLILENRPAVWAKEHPAIQRLKAKHGQWLAGHPMLVVPIYMLGQSKLQTACYNAANDRLEALGCPRCEFSDAGKVIANFRADAERYGEVVYQQFQDATGISRSRFDRLAGGSQAQQDELAQQILSHRQISRSEKAQLYPDKFSDGITMLTRHAQAHGFHGITFLIDELILYLGGKKGNEYISEFNDLVALADNSALDRVVPLWVIVARQRNIAELVPDDTSQQHIHDAMEHHKDRFPETTTLADTELVPIVQERVLRVQDGMQSVVRQTIDNTLTGLGDEVRHTLMHDLTPDDFRRVYPFHPALIRTLIDVTARLSRERAAIRLLYELLIQHHPDLPLGKLVPYGTLFDVVFLEEGLASGSRNEELEAVRQTYYERLLPLIEEAYQTESQAERAQLVVKTALLCGLSKTMQNAITVERILHLNYKDLQGRTPFGSYQVIAQILSDLDKRSELVHFTADPANPAQGVTSITLAAGAQLSDVLKRVRVNWRQRLDAFTGLMRELLGKPIQNGEIPGYERVWRGSRRRGRVRFTNIAELSIMNDLTVAAHDEFTLFVDYPFDAEAAYTRADDRQLIERAKKQLGPLRIGFWLPTEFSADDSRDLMDYARILEVESNPNLYLAEYGRSQRLSLESKLAGQKRSKARALRERLSELYKGPGAEVTFLDSTITPTLDAQTVGDALDRIADAVCDRLYPHHPRFPSEANQRALRRLLEDFLIPAAQQGGAVPRNVDLDGLLIRLGEPLELAERGAQNWTLRPQSRYLSKLMELAAGKRVQADTIRQGLVDAFGFNRDLTDTFLLYLIRGKGYRALRGNQPVTTVDYGGLHGLTLERGERLAVFEWAEVKEFVKDTWLLQPAITELSVAAQDKLWNQLNAAARKTAGELNEIRQRLAAAITEAQADVDQAPRLAALDAALELNAVAQRMDMDAHDGLKTLLGWKPDTGEVQRMQAASQIAKRQQTDAALVDLELGTVKRIITLAQGSNASAQAAQEALQRFLAAPAEEADLTSHIVSWMEQANKIIDAALDTTGIATTGAGKAGSGKDPRDTGGEEIGQREEKADYHVTSVRLILGDKQHPLDVQTIRQALAPLLQQVAAQTDQDQDEVQINIVLSKRKDR